MYPVNQVILGGDSMFSNIDDIDLQIQKMEAYRNRLHQLKTQNVQQPTKLWDDIDAEISPLSDEQKNRLMQDEEYADIYSKLQQLVQMEILNSVKSKIENTSEGKELLQRQLKIVKRLKGKVIDDTNREMEMFKMFRDYSKNNPGITYDEFLKNNL